MVETIQPKTIKNLVIFRTDRIGEVLLSTVCIDILAKHFPDSRISFVTSDYAKDIVSGRSDIKEVFIFNTIRKVNLFSGIAKLTSFLKKRKFDLALILNPHKILHASCYLAGVKYRAGYNKKWGLWLTHKIEDKKYECKKHEIEYNLDLLKALGVKNIQVKPPYLAILKEDSDYAARQIKQFGFDNGKPIISIHPGSSNPAKRWPLNNFISLINRIKGSIDCNVALLGGTEDKGLILNILESIECKAANLAGAFTIKQLAAFLNKSALFIGNDAGPMHIAAAMGTPVIALFGGASNPVRWRPWGEGHVILHKDDISAITIGEVTEAVMTVPSLRGAIATKQSQK